MVSLLYKWHHAVLFDFELNCYRSQDLFQDFAQEGANSLWEVSRWGKYKSKEEQPHIKYRESQLPREGAFCRPPLK